MRTKRSFSFQLLKNFLLSTLLPFMLITSVIAHIYSREYNKDIHILLNSTVNSLTSNISTYLDELKQVTLQPYYNDELFGYLRNLSKGNSYHILDELPLKQNLDSNMSFVRYSRSDINGIFIFKDGQCLYYTVENTDKRTLVRPMDYASKDWYQEALDADGRCLLLGPHIPDYIEPYDSTVISLARSIVAIESREPLYVIKIDINTSIFDRIFKDFSFHVKSKIIITDENQQMIYSNSDLEPQDLPQIREVLSSDDAAVKLADGSYKSYTYPIEDCPWKITILLSGRELSSKTGVIYLTAILLYLAGIVMATVSHMAISKRIVASISRMKDVFLSIQNRDFSKRYHYVSNTELDDLGDSLNQTASQLEQTIQKEYIMALRQKDIEFRALQAQIQPHFLFNTLNNFIALNQVGDRDTLEDALYELSGMLRYILKAPAVIPLSMELKFIEDYCNLQKLRFSDRLSYEIHCDAMAGQRRIPKLLLQPIVENSILHGIEPCGHPCHILISARESEEELIITVSDNGVGYATGDAAGNGIGLENVKDRLKSFCPGSKMDIRSIKDEGTVTTIYLFKQESEESP